MKKILALLVCLLIVSISVRADDDRPVRFDQLPVKAQAYVKKYFPQEKVALAKMEKDFFGNVQTPFRLVNNKVIVPDEAEIERNPRSRSAKLRIAEKK